MATAVTPIRGRDDPNGTNSVSDTPIRPSLTMEARYELLRDDPEFGLSKGDVLVCEPMHWAWASEKVAVVRRESDGYEPGCSQYRGDIQHLSGPVL